MEETQQQTEIKAAPLTASEAQQRLTEIKTALTDIDQRIEQVREMLLEFRDRNGHKALGYDTLRDCIEKTFNVTKSHAYRLIDAATLHPHVSELAEKHGITLRESHLRALSSIEEPTQQREVLEYAIAKAPKRTDGAPKLTRERVEQAVREATSSEEAMLGEFPSETDDRHSPKGETTDSQLESPEPRAPDVLDSEGRRVPETIRWVFERDILSAFQRIASHAQQIRFEASALQPKQGESPSTDLHRVGQFIQQSSFQSLEAESKNIWHTVRQCMRPHAVCPGCNADARGMQDCRICNGAGWVTEMMWNAIPDDLKGQR